MKNLSISDSCCHVDTIYKCAKEYLLEPLPTDGLRVCIISNANLKNNKVQAYEVLLDKNLIIQNQCFKFLTRIVPK